jgi:shikimate dehydrogenase
MEHGRLRADSTDGAGLLAALAEQAPALDVRGRPVLILGAGGAARAAAAALKGAGAEVGVLNRTPARAGALAADLGVRVAGSPDALGGGRPGGQRPQRSAPEIDDRGAAATTPC